MSSVWSWYIIVGTVVSMLACFWLIVWTNKQRASDDELAESESHVWDENVRELNNPLPMWWLWLFVIMSITLELLEIMTLAYEAAEEWEVIGPLLGGQLLFSFVGIQLILGAMVPIILLGIVVLMSRYLTDQIRNTLCFAASLLLLMRTCT